MVSILALSKNSSKRTLWLTNHNTLNNKYVNEEVLTTSEQYGNIKIKLPLITISIVLLCKFTMKCQYYKSIRNTFYTNNNSDISYVHSQKKFVGYLTICKRILVNRRSTLSLDENQNFKAFKLGATTINKAESFKNEYKYRGYFELLTKSSNNISVI